MQSDVKNQDRLYHCKGGHNFVPCEWEDHQRNEGPITRCRCTKCQGELPAEEARWYIRGIAAGALMVADDKTVTCVYCGEAYPENTPTHGAGVPVLTEHIKTCPKHPMQALITFCRSLIQKWQGACPSTTCGSSAHSTLRDCASELSSVLTLSGLPQEGPKTAPESLWDKVVAFSREWGNGETEPEKIAEWVKACISSASSVTQLLKKVRP